MKWAEVAVADLEAAAGYIARDSPNYAAAFVQELRDAARSLRRFGERGRAVPEVEDPAIRELIVGSYRLIYQVTRETIFVLAIVHGARDLAALWSKRSKTSR